MVVKATDRARVQFLSLDLEAGKVEPKECPAWALTGEKNLTKKSCKLHEFLSS